MIRIIEQQIKNLEEQIINLEQDIIILDPPWGGSEYYSKKTMKN